MAAKKPAAKAKKPTKAVSRTIVKKAAPPVKAAAKAKHSAAPAKPVAKAKPTSAVAGKAAAPAKTVAPIKAAAKAPPPAQKASVPPRPAVATSAVKVQPKLPQSMPPKSIPRNSDFNASNGDDDNDGAENPSSNLLAGPRNVQPYIPKRGEQYMGKAQLAHFHTILSSWKRDLMEEVDRTVLHMKDEAANFPDPNDRATQESEFSLELRTRDRERKLIRKIDEAIKRIEDGSYGYCNETGEEIGVKRLEARPVATLSVEAQERRERREKQYGDRDDRYR
jgi:DnaK suppressor protein